MSLQTLKDLFIRELRGLYAAEFQVSEALPRFVRAASNDELRSVLESHDQVTRKHITRLERIFQRLGVSECGSKCCGAEDAISDAGLIAAIQRIEHYAIAAYGAARKFADTLGYDDLAWTLTETLEDEREADEQLSALAVTAVNLEAAEAPEVG